LDHTAYYGLHGSGGRFTNQGGVETAQQVTPCQHLLDKVDSNRKENGNENDNENELDIMKVTSKQPFSFTAGSRARKALPMSGVGQPFSDLYSSSSPFFPPPIPLPPTDQYP
jgi:hypothetical protein